MNVFPHISVLMPVYNCELYVEVAIQSILNQTFKNFELIIIDDASKDKTAAIVRSFVDPRIVFIDKSVNTGYTASLNCGLEKAKGKYIARMDGDDISVPERLERQFQFLEANPDFVLCGTWVQIISTKQIIKHPSEHEDIKSALLTYCPIAHPSVLFRTSFFRNHKLKYDLDMEPAEDYDLWTKLVMMGKMANIPSVLLYYRIHNSQVSNVEMIKQNKNAELCRIRMLDYLISKNTAEDELLKKMLCGLTNIETFVDLEKVLLYLDELNICNDTKKVYKQDTFEFYIDVKRKSIIRNYFLLRDKYNLRLLFTFLKFDFNIKNNLSKVDQAKLIIKCMLHWQTKSYHLLKAVYCALPFN